MPLDPRRLSFTAVALAMLTGAAGDSVPAADGPALQQIAVSFRAHDFGRGPPDSRMVREVEGSFTLEYDRADPARATLRSFELRAVNGPARAGWADGFAAEDLQVEVSATSILIGRHAPLSSVSGATDDFLLRLHFDAGDPDAGAAVLAKFAYALPRDPQVYESNRGSVTVSRLPATD